jgi:hypothetical protein
MGPLEIVLVIGAVLMLALLAYAVRQRPTGDAPTSRPARSAFQRFYDTQEHSDAFAEERASGRPGPHERMGPGARRP